MKNKIKCMVIKDFPGSEVKGICIAPKKGEIIHIIAKKRKGIFAAQYLIEKDGVKYAGDANMDLSKYVKKI